MLFPPTLKRGHDIFCYELWVNEYYQVVIVFPRTDTPSSEVFGNLVHPREQPFCFCHKPLRSRQPEGQSENANHVSQLAVVSNMCAAPSDLRAISEHVERDIYCPNTSVVLGADDVIFAEQESAAQSVPGSNLTQPALLQFAKTRNLSIEQSELRNQALLQKRHFFHSHRAQPMALEQVMAQEDSEDEVDDDVPDLEDRRMLDDFLDVTQDEKHTMRLWNLFIRNQWVLADAHVPWACETFLDFHGEELVQNMKLNCFFMRIIL